MDADKRFRILLVAFVASALVTAAGAALGWWLQGWIGLILGVLIAMVAGDIPLALIVNRQARRVGPEALVGRSALVERPFANGVGQVRLDGSLWKARLRGDAACPPAPGEAVHVAAVEGITLAVTRDRARP